MIAVTRRGVQWLMLAVLLLSLPGGLAGAPAARVAAQQPPLVISEIRIDQVGADADEYFELAGPPGASLDGLTYIVLGDGLVGSGVIEAVVPLTGHTIPPSGFFVVAEGTFTLGAANLSIMLNFENSDNVTHLLVQGFTGTDGQDLDIDDDGVLDETPWAAVIDKIALIVQDNPPISTEFHYGPPTVGPDGQFVPGHAYRCGTTWLVGAFAIGTTDTPGAPNPCQIADLAPVVMSTTPAGGAGNVPVDTAITVVFSEPVTVGATWAALACGSSGPIGVTTSGSGTTYTLSPAATLPAGDICTVTIVAGQVSDTDGDDPPDTPASDYVFSFSTAGAAQGCGAPATLIHAIQGGGATSPLANTLQTIEGVVVGDFQGSSRLRGFFVQEEDSDADADPATSEGIFVFDGSFGVDVAVGDRVRVAGRVTEYFNLTEITDVTALDVCARGVPLPGPAVLNLPVGGPEDWEAVEGMRVVIPQTLTVGDTYNLGRYGQVGLFAGGPAYQFTQISLPDAAALDAYEEALTRRAVWLDDGSNVQNPPVVIHPAPELTASNTLRAGDTVTGLTGVVNYSFDLYRLEPVEPVVWTHANPRPESPPAVGGTLTVASFNVLNYFNGDGLGGGFPTSRGANTPAEFERQRTKIIAALAALRADVVGLMEIENDGDGPQSAIADLVGGLNAALGTGAYDYIRTGVIGSDEIRVALIYRPGTVRPVGEPAVLTSAAHPLFDDTRNRPAVAQTFEDPVTGERFTVVVNHLKSKGSACGPGDDDLSTGQGNCNGTRENAATALAEWLATDPTGSGTDRILIIGDLNAYAREDPVVALEAAGYANLIARDGGYEAYSYLFSGLRGSLDHALASAALEPLVTGAAPWHINADEPRVLDYNDTIADPGESAADTRQSAAFYAPTVYRSADHDPLVIGLRLDGAQAEPTPAAGEGGAPAIGVFDPAVSKVGELPAGGIGLVGEALTWHITVTNNGTAAGTDIEVVDTVRPELRIDSVETEQGTFRVEGQTVTFLIPRLEPGQIARMRINTTVLSSPLGEVRNEVTVRGFGPDGVAVNAQGGQGVAIATELPATGYPVDGSSGAGESLSGLWGVLAAALAGMIAGGVWLVRRARVRR